MERSLPSAPRRLWVVGPCGAGKSTVARQVGARLDLPVTHVDELRFLPRWVTRPEAELRSELEARAAADSWVIDGNLGPAEPWMWELAARAELIVWLDLPLCVTWPRLLRRGLWRSLFREPCCNGNHESLRRTFLSRESLLLYALASDGPRRRQYEARLEELAVVRLRSAREVSAWLDAPPRNRD